LANADAAGFEAPAWQLAVRPYGWLGTFAAMASPCEVHVVGGDRAGAVRAVTLAAAEAARIERKYSRYRADNVVHAINTAEGRTVEVDEETARLLDYAARLFELSDGRFDITSGVLRRAWSFDGSDRVPTRAAVAELMKAVGWQKVRWRAPHLTLRAGMQIDLGGIGKEHAVDRAAALAAREAQGCLVNFGGDLLALGDLPAGRPWAVGVESLADSSTAAKEIELERGALATSGDARRYVLRDGKRYGHVLDATTGWPVDGAPRSVTVAAPSCTQAGMLATLALLHGRRAEEFLRAQGARFWCLR
jgi:thiamine biosynthesis lipoprotein